MGVVTPMTGREPDFERAKTALFEAQIIMLREGFRVPEIVVNDACYWQAIAASGPNFRTSDPTGRRTRRIVSDGMGNMTDLWVAPDEEDSFVLSAPGGPLRVHRETRQRKA